MNTGAFGEGFPYTNFHDLNMDWIIKIAKDFLDQYTHIQETITNGENSLTTLTTEGLPPSWNMLEDAKAQIKKALDRVEEVMGIRPKGFWPPELCLGPKTLNILAKEGIEWTISDEGILSDSINFDFIRDFKGNLNDTYHLLKVYG